MINYKILKSISFFMLLLYLRELLDMNDKFILMNKEKALLLYMEKYIFPALPKNETSIKIKLNDEVYKMIENTIRANVNKGNIRNKYINEIKVNIMMIDFLIGNIYSKELIIKKRYLSTLRIITDIKNITYSLGNNNES